MRQFIGNVLVVLVLGFTVWVSVVTLWRIQSVVLKSDYLRLYLGELALCAILLACALDVRFDLAMKLPAPLGLILRVIVIALAVAILILLLCIAINGMISEPGQTQYALVLGMALEDGKPTGDLLRRLDVAESILQENPEAALILCGGNPDQTGVTEAAVMRDLLIARGVPSEKLILEDRSSITEENFSFTAGMVDPSEPIALITSDFHMTRALRCAAQAGFHRVLRRPAPSSILRFGPNLLAEAVLHIRDFVNAHHG